MARTRRLVKSRFVGFSVFANRSQAIQAAVDEKIERMGRDRLARECAKLNPAEEKELAEEGLAITSRSQRAG